MVERHTSANNGNSIKASVPLSLGPAPVLLPFLGLVKYLSNNGPANPIF